MDYKIISDGCCDLGKDVIEKYQLHVIPFYISFDDETYYKAVSYTHLTLPTNSLV